jgi:hypothetical protein
MSHVSCQLWQPAPSLAVIPPEKNLPVQSTIQRSSKSRAQSGLLEFDRLCPSRYNKQSSSVIGVYPRVREAPTPSDRCGRGSDSVDHSLCRV